MTSLPGVSGTLSAEGACSVEQLTTFSQLRCVAAEWAELWQADPHSTPFQHPAWLLPWWEHVGEGELFCHALRSANGRLQALLPGYIYTQPETRERHLLLLGAGTSDYLDGVFAPPDAPRFAAMLLRAVEDTRSRWDRAFLSQLRENSPLLTGARVAGFRIGTAEPCSSIRVLSFEELPAKLRGNLRRYTRRAQTEADLQFSLASTPEAATSALHALIALHGKRWKGRGEPGVLAPPAIQQQHLAAIPGLLDAGLLHLFELRLHSVAIAVLYGLRRPAADGAPPASRQPLMLYLIGFDPAHAELSPGSLLLSAVFDFCVERQIPAMDLLRGGETYKQLWGADAQPTFAVDLSR